MFKKSKSSNLSLILSIIFASTVISGSLVFFGMKLFASPSFDSPEFEKEVVKIVYKYNKTIANKNTDNPVPEKVPEIKIDLDEIKGNDAVLGNENAPVTIVEFSDYQCPFCRSFYNGAYQEIKEKYVDTGKVKVIFRDFPLSFHKDAMPAAMATECVREQKGDEAFFQMHNKIFEGQSGNGTDSISSDSLTQYAKEIGVDLDQYKDCVDSEKYKKEILEDQQYAQKVNIKGAPGFYINETQIIGARPFSSFEEIIEAELAK